MTLLSKLFTKFPKLRDKIQKIPGSEKYVNPEGLIVPQNLGTFLNELGSEVYRGVGKPDGTSEISVSFEFDQMQRVSNTINPMVDGEPKVLPFQVVEKVNDMMTFKLKNAPANYKIKRLDLTIRKGEVFTNAQYYA